jgi:predicted transcriptional regulator
MYYMATITLRVPDELDQALERQSTAAGVSKSDLAREALRRFLAVSEFQRLRARLVKRAQAQGIHTDEDVFRALDRP